jgi:hypothetical protein
MYNAQKGRKPPGVPAPRLSKYHCIDGRGEPKTIPGVGYPEIVCSHRPGQAGIGGMNSVRHNK